MAFSCTSARKSLASCSVTLSALSAQLMRINIGSRNLRKLDMAKLYHSVLSKNLSGL